MNTHTRVFLVLTGCLAVGFLAPTRAIAQTEAPPVLAAPDLAPAELLAVPGIEVDGRVPTDGFYGIFTVGSPYGSVQARGVAMLRIRVAEMQALASLEEVSRREAMVGGARESAQQTVQGAVQTIENPVGTAEAVPQGVGRLFSRIEGKVEKDVGRFTGQEDSSAPAGEREGIANERRALAHQLGVDPYTDNPLLSSKLDQVARWKRHGAIAVSVATGSASAIAGAALRAANLVWTQPPEEVRATNEKRLTSLAYGASAEDIRAFLDNGAFTPTTQTLLVEEIESLRVPHGRDSLVRLAARMTNHDQARFLIASMGLLAAYHEHVAPLSSVESRGLLAVGLTPAGSLVLAVPVDRLAWTDRLVEFAGRSDLHAARREILVTGSVTPRTRQELSSRGWSLRERFGAEHARPGTAPEPRQQGWQYPGQRVGQ